MSLSIEVAAKLLRNARRVVVFTGAGISADSGIPTFRDPLTGLWERYDPERLETANAFREDAALIWGWYLWRRQKVAQASPNAAHLAIVSMVSDDREVTVITQNIDDLHERAGSVGVLHLHGSLASPKCFACHRPAIEELPPIEITEEGTRVEPPRCLKCNGKLRPGIVWFGETLPSEIWKEAVAAIKACDLFLSIGTSGVVFPAAALPSEALANGAVVIHVNPTAITPLEKGEFVLVGTAAEYVPHLTALADLNDSTRDSTKSEGLRGR